VTTQNKVDDPYVQHHIGEMSVNVETASSMVKARRQIVGNREIQGSADCRQPRSPSGGTPGRGHGQHCIRACGARCLNRPSALERIYRDLSFYVRHDNDDHILAMIGKSLLGLTHDPLFTSPDGSARCGALEF